MHLLVSSMFLCLKRGELTIAAMPGPPLHRLPGHEGPSGSSGLPASSSTTRHVLDTTAGYNPQLGPDGEPALPPAIAEYATPVDEIVPGRCSTHMRSFPANEPRHRRQNFRSFNYKQEEILLGSTVVSLHNEVFANSPPVFSFFSFWLAQCFFCPFGISFSVLGNFRSIFPMLGNFC